MILQQDQLSLDQVISRSGSVDIIDYKQGNAEKAAHHAKNKNPFARQEARRIEAENQKIMKQLFRIQAGKQLNVASHNPDQQSERTFKSLHYGKNVKIAEKIDSDNEKLLKGIQNAKTSVPSGQALLEHWDN